MLKECLKNSESVCHSQILNSKQLFTNSFRLNSSVTRLGDLLHFGQAFKAGGNNYLPKSPTLLGNFYKGVKITHFSSDYILGQLL